MGGAGEIPLASGVSGKAWLRSRTFRGADGSPAAGKRGYQYQVDLTQATSLAEAPCVTDLVLDFGEIVPLKYGAGPPNHIYVIPNGGSRPIGLFAAEINDGKLLPLPSTSRSAPGLTPAPATRVTLLV